MWTPQRNKEVWAEVHQTGDRFKPRWPVEVCPKCGREPVFIQIIGDGKWGKMEWVGIDYCAKHSPCPDKYVAEAIRDWNLTVRIMKDMDSQPAPVPTVTVRFRDKIRSFFNKLWNGDK